jgi:hypothetical protein
MEHLISIYQFVMAHGLDILGACLTVLGGLKVIARYTSFTWDDKAIETLEKPVKVVIGLLPKKEK